MCNLVEGEAVPIPTLSVLLKVITALLVKLLYMSNF